MKAKSDWKKQQESLDLPQEPETLSQTSYKMKPEAAQRIKDIMNNRNQEISKVKLFKPRKKPPKPKKTKKSINTDNLTVPQKLFIKKAVNSFKSGRMITPEEAEVGVKPKKELIAYDKRDKKDLKNIDFRKDMINGLIEDGIIGPYGKIHEVLQEGLDATDRLGLPDHKLRLAYIQEVNRILGVYAPNKQQVSSVKMNLDLTADEVDKKINELQDQMGDVVVLEAEVVS